jgi:hypothetical protein
MLTLMSKVRNYIFILQISHNVDVLVLTLVIVK